VRQVSRIACLLLAVCLAGCEADSWLRWGGVRAFREIDSSEARRILQDPVASVLQLKTTRFEPTLTEAIVLEPNDPLPETLLAAGRILVVTTDGAEGRRLSARLVRAGARRVALVVEDPVELGAPRSPLLARPVRP
jgi:hypothetical protein